MPQSIHQCESLCHPIHNSKQSNACLSFHPSIRPYIHPIIYPLIQPFIYPRSHPHRKPINHIFHPSTHLSIHSFNQAFCSASSSPLLLRGAPYTARTLCRSFTPKRYRQLRVKDLRWIHVQGPKVEFESTTLRTKGDESTNKPPHLTSSYNPSIIHTTISTSNHPSNHPSVNL